INPATKPEESQRWSKAYRAPFGRPCRPMLMNISKTTPNLGRNPDLIVFTILYVDLNRFPGLGMRGIVCILIGSGLRNGFFLDPLDLQFLVFDGLLEPVNLLGQAFHLRIMPDIPFYLFGDLVVDFDAQFPERVVQGVITVHLVQPDL